MDTKAQSISINTIIVAAIALAVLVVLFLIFTGRLGLFTKGVGETTNCQQACKAAGYNSGDPLDENEIICKAGQPPLPGYYVIADGIRKKCCCTN